MAVTHYLEFPTKLSDNSMLFIRTSIESSFLVDHIDVTADTINASFKEPVTKADFDALVKKLLFICKTINK